MEYQEEKLPKRRKSKIWSNVAIYAATGAITAATVGAVVYLFVLNDDDIKTDMNQIDQNVYKELGESLDYYYDLEGKVYDENDKPTDNRFLVEVNVWKAKVGDSYKYYLGDPEDGTLKRNLQKMIRIIFDNSNHGPELTALKRITIDSTILTSDLEKGIYYPSTYEIGLNGSALLESIEATEKAVSEEYVKHNQQPPQLTEEQMYNNRINLMSEVLAHEYGHHIANIYASSPAPDAVTVKVLGTNPITGKRSRTNKWSEDFYNDFKTTFGYTLPTTDSYPDFYSSTDSDNAPSIASLGDAKTIFESVNETDSLKSRHINPESIVKFGDLNAPGDVSRGHVGYQQFLRSFSGSRLEDLDYWYSVEEEFTRKMILTSFVLPMDYVSTTIMNSYSSDVISELTKSATLYSNTNRNQLNLTGTNYLDDYVFDLEYDQRDPRYSARSVKFARMIDKMFGHNVGADISYVIGQNDSYVVPVQGGTSGIYTDDKMMASRNPNNIKFGGYIPNDSDYKYVGYMDGNDFVKINITTSNVAINSKYEALGTSSRLLTNGEEKFYVTNEYIDGSTLVGKQLFFANEDLSVKTPLETVKTAYGGTSSYKEELPSAYSTMSTYKIYTPVEDSNTNGVMFTESSIK